MKNIQFPLNFKFNISTFANDFVASDMNGRTIAYVKQKMFKFIDEITVYSDETQTAVSYMIKANKWIDFSAAYNFTDNTGKEIGKVARKGWVSLWKAKYEVFNPAQQLEYTIQEENGWVKVGDALLGEIPILNLFTGYFFHPSYKVTDQNGTMVARLKKESSFFGRKFSVDKLYDIKEEHQERIVLSLMMMILLERRRG